MWLNTLARWLANQLAKTLTKKQIQACAPYINSNIYHETCNPWGIV